MKPTMTPSSVPWWTDERVQETVTSAYVHSHLRPSEQELLQRPLYFGGDLTDDTYLDWILTRAKRFFLVLVASNVPDQIFGIIDDSYDDEDLPVVENAVPELRLSYEPDRALDKRFYKNQFRFLTRVVGEGEHIRYADEETVPVVPLSLKSLVFPKGHDATDRVRLPLESSKIVLRRRIVLDNQLTEEDVLAEIAASRKLCHEHVTSVFGSYLQQGVLNVLSLPAAEWNLKSFLLDPPKSFNVLPKPVRHSHLINWPHCLANALAWLHDNGEYHGAIRPSNIQIDDTFRISLGMLEGDGVLRDTVRSDEIEPYQYAPPERWKRAITIQNTGSVTVSLPSGGRSGRKLRTGTSGDGRSTSSSRPGSIATFRYEPTSRGKHARLRLSAAIGPDAVPRHQARDRNIRSAADNKSISTQGTARAKPSKPASVISSTSSSGRKTGSSNRSNPVYASAFEGRSAVVQTWQSVEDDMFSSDVFSLGAVILDILTILCKRSYSSFSRHRSSKNRNAGRGGGLADASFHANLGQVFLWAQTLQNDAEKKAKKEGNQTLHAVGPIIQLTLQCLERDPFARLTSEGLEAKLASHISQFADTTWLHCAAEKPRPPETPTPRLRPTASSNRLLNEAAAQGVPSPSTVNGSSLSRERRQAQQQLILPDADILRAPICNTPSLHRTISISTTPGTMSASSLASFNFDGLSDTVVGESPRSREPSRRGGFRKHYHAGQLDPSIRSDVDSQDQAALRWNMIHKNDSEVDPRLSFGESVDQGAFTYINYSTSASESEEGAKYFPRPPSTPTHPPTKAPDRALPPVPAVPHRLKTSRSKPIMRTQPKPLIDLDLLRQLSNVAAGGHPVRTDSLSHATTSGTELDESDDEDYQDLLQHARQYQAAKAARDLARHQKHEQNVSGRARYQRG